MQFTIRAAIMSVIDALSFLFNYFLVFNYDIQLQRKLFIKSNDKQFFA